MLKLIFLLFPPILIGNIFCQNPPIDKILIDKSEFQKIISSNNDSLKIETIDMLIKIKGDETINNTWFGFTNKFKQDEYNAKKSTNIYDYPLATNQFVALYLISAIYYSDTEFCEKIQIEYKGKDGNTKNTTNLRWKYCPKQKEDIKNHKFKGVKFKIVDSKIIKMLYKEYEDWYNEVKENGLKDVKPPLNESSYKWYGYSKD
jgi:hypothetical protein